jgi:hypothetical protein
VAETGTASALLANGCDFLHILMYSTSAQSTSTTKHAAAIPPMRPAYCFKESKRMGRDKTGIRSGVCDRTYRECGTRFDSEIHSAFCGLVQIQYDLNMS